LLADAWRTITYGVLFFVTWRASAPGLTGAHEGGTAVRQLHLYLLGAPRIEGAGVSIQVDTRKAIALLAYFAVRRERHQRDALATFLWPEHDRTHGRTALRRTLYALRKAVGSDWLIADRECAGLDPSADLWLDVEQFHSHLDELQGHGHPLADVCPDCIPPLTAAAGLYRGDFMEGFGLNDSLSFDEWQYFQADALRRAYAGALGKLVRCHSAQGAFALAINYGKRWLALDELDEAAHCWLMQLYAWTGQRSAALRQYVVCAQALESELGTSPQAATTELHQAIKRGPVRAPPIDPRFQRATETVEVQPQPHSISRKLPVHRPLPSPEQGAERVGIIRCPNCGDSSPPGTAFCRVCGSRLLLHCLSCGAAVPVDAAFCGQCGARLAKAPTPAHAQLRGERRRATFIHVRVHEATALAERIGIEPWAEVVNQLYHILGAEVHRFGGEVDQYHGNGLLASFGTRVAHEDDPERAVRAALAMQDAVRRWAAELRKRDKIELCLQVGVHTGEVIATGVPDGGQQGPDTAIGRALALAAQMADAAEQGTVLVSDSTFRQVRPLFEWESMGEVVVEGMSGPIAVYRPLVAKFLPGKPRGIEGLSSPLVGRDAELGALQRAVERVRAGVGGIVTLVGEAGIGKSRLVSEVQRLALNREPSPGLQWIEGRCLSYTTNVAYQLWLDMLRALLEVGPDDPPSAIRDALGRWLQELCPERFDDVYPYLERMMLVSREESAEAGLHGLGAESLKAYTFRAVEALVAGAARRGPLVVVCEDLHWADPTSLELLERLLALTDRGLLLFICVFRPQTERDCWRIKETAARRYAHRHTDLVLGPLSDAESEVLAGYLLRVEGLSPRLRARILDRAEGNPFYVEEILRSLIGDGSIVHDAPTGRWYAARDVDRIPVPDTLHGLLMARIDRLEVRPRHVLQLAAVAGRIFSYPVLSVVTGEDAGGTGAEDLEEHLAVLQRAQMIRERSGVPEREYIFKHELTREAAYNSLLRRERCAYHRRVAQALEQLYPNRIGEQVERLAYHWERAEEPGAAIDYLLRAGSQARAAYANREAIAHVERGLKLLERLPEGHSRARRELDLLLTLGIPLTLIKGHASPEVQEAYLRARDLCDQLGDEGQRFSVLVGLRRSQFMRGELREARSSCQQLLSLARRTGDAVPLSWSQVLQVETLYWLGEFAETHGVLEHHTYAPSFLQRRSCLASYGNDPAVGSQIYGALALWHLGCPDRARVGMRRVLDLAEELSHPFTTVFALAFAAMFHQLRRDAEEVQSCAAVVLRLSAERGFTLFSALGTSLHGWALAQLGRVEEGIVQLQEGIASWRAIGGAAMLPTQLLYLAEAYGRAGQVNLALETLEDASQLIARTGERCYEAEVYRLQGEMHVLRAPGEVEPEACFQRAIGVARRQDAKSWELRASTSLARLWRAQGKRAEAREALQGVYGRFSEGFGDPDLQEARALLTALA
jgi:DNA-binding SARP family transcriptional activator/class 3 adenylate cyclase/predicted ATPase